MHRHTKTPLAQFVVPEKRFDHVIVDLVAPHPLSHGYIYLLTMVNRTTRWPEAVPLSSTAPWLGAAHRAVSRGVADAFAPVPTSRHGLPQTYIPKDLQSAKSVFIRHDSHRTPLQPPYNGPFVSWRPGLRTLSLTWAASQSGSRWTV